MGETSSFGGEWIFAFLIIAVIFGWGGAGFGGGNANVAAYATMADVNSAINNQSTQQALAAVQLSSANNNYETARLIDAQTLAMSNQNNTNLINAIQGFNTTNQTISSGFASVNQNIADLGYKMDQCCCSIKTMLLENRLQDVTSALQNQQNIAVNQAQSEFLLSQMGKWVANAPAAAAAYTVAK
jgi:hypothetical protein